MFPGLYAVDRTVEVQELMSVWLLGTSDLDEQDARIME